MKYDKDSDSFFTHFPEGCHLCYKGAKLVLFVTGLCQKNCFYCPVSEARSRKDVIFANERPVLSEKDILEEAHSMNAMGTGITGGEPILVLERVLAYIRLLKITFGRSHHIHLYTAQSPHREILEKLKTAGLDEIRFHPPFEIFDSISESGFDRSVSWAKELNLDVGFEIPSIQGAEYIAKFALDHDVFLNLNELEFSESNRRAMKEMDFTVKDDESCAAKGSREVAFDIIKKSPQLKAHYCSSCFKDAVQLRKRLQRTAEITARKFDEITSDGTLIYGVIQGEISEIVRLLTRLRVPQDLYYSNQDRVELGWWVLHEISSEIGDRVVCWYEESYPSFGRMVVEKIPLGAAMDFNI